VPLKPAAAIHVFDYTQIEASSYGAWATKLIKGAVNDSRGTVALNDGDLSSWKSIRGLTGNANRVVPATATGKSSPLETAEQDHRVGVYVVSVWAEDGAVHERIRAVFDREGMHCYLGYLLFDGPGSQASWCATMRQKLYLPPNVVLVNGRVSGGDNKYGIQ
jgi:hypothetical protein